VDSSFRPLIARELQLLERLLEPDFPGCDELRHQLKSVTAKTIDEDGGLALQCDPSLPAPVDGRIPTEGKCADADGVVIHVLLHVVAGVMNELEVYREDTCRVLSPPVAGALAVCTQYSGPVVDWGSSGGKPGPDGT
jgi:hypothetical protein